ncbi:universal stress protein [Spirosoma validum]|uniref:Universal stress protein n=1 Tax=Spirosoma validum TaxID=2771355 RepID=A0A927GGE9_9BACT|nr:universal stress protein [Spirosoma validum]MBD2756535.1 universal stress protein [Spirosoma validum]
MTTIVVATDLSANSHWATDYALALARQLRVRLVLVHIFNPFSTWTMRPVLTTIATAEQHEHALQQLTNLRIQMLESTNYPVDISVVARPGLPVEKLAQEAVSQKADLLVMGVVGNEPLKARQVGSLAIDMIPHTQVPMLLVPPGAMYKKPQTLVLGIGLSNPVDTQSLASAKRFAQLLSVRLEVICMANEPDEQLHKASDSISILLTDQPHTIGFLPGNDLSEVLSAYALTHQTDLIMLLPKHHHWLSTFLLESDTQEVARLTTIPVLAAV